MNSYDVAYSLRLALENNVPELTDVKFVYEGVDLTTVPKPFASVQYLQDMPEVLSAGRRSYYDTFNFQVGIYARDVGERHRLEDKVRSVLRKPEGHPLYEYNEVTGLFVDSGKLMPLYDNGFTPIGNDDNSNQTFSFHGYFDVAAEIIT